MCINVQLFLLLETDVRPVNLLKHEILPNNILNFSSNLTEVTL
jgi:hypothetical protein